MQVLGLAWVNMSQKEKIAHVANTNQHFQLVVPRKEMNKLKQ